MPQYSHDIIVIGAGSAGLSVSLFMAEVGLKTLLIDKTDFNIGGDCLNYGCVPSKALLHVAKKLNNSKNFNKRDDIHIEDVMQYVYERQQKIRAHENAAYMRSKGLDVELGIASFFDKQTVIVNGKKFSAKKIVIATGSRPKQLHVSGIDKIKYYNNESIFDLKHLPKTMLIVGGGPVATEMAFAFASFGTKVSMVVKDDYILPKEDQSISKILMEQLGTMGIKFICNSAVDLFKEADTALLKTNNGQLSEYSADAFFIAVGRTTDAQLLAPEKANIQIEKNKIISNKYLQTTNKNIYVCGDISGNLEFSHAAEQQARLLLNNFFSPIKKSLNNNYMSWVTFTEPEVATFGLSATQLQHRNIDFEKLELDFDEDDRATTDDYNYGKLILFISKNRFKQKILGGSMIAPNAGEMIQELILAMQAKLHINQIFNKVYPYPVASRVNQMLVVQHKQKSLTPMLKKLLRLLYKL